MDDFNCVLTTCKRICLDRLEDITPHKVPRNGPHNCRKEYDIYELNFAINETILEKAVKPWLFTRGYITVIYNERIKRVLENRVELLSKMGQKSIDKIKKISVSLENPTNESIRTVFRDSEKFKVLHINEHCTYPISVFSIALDSNPRLSVIEWPRSWNSYVAFEEDKLDNIDRKRLLGLKEFSFGDNADGKHWIEFLASLKNIRTLSLKATNVGLVLDKCNFIDLRNLTLEGPTAYNSTNVYVAFQFGTMRGLTYLYIYGINFAWHDLAVTCPRLLELKIVYCQVTNNFTYDGSLCLQSLHLENLKWTSVTYSTLPVLRQITRSPLHTLNSSLFVIERVVAIDKWIWDEELLVNCVVSFKRWYIKRMVFQTTRHDRIRLYLWKLQLVEHMRWVTPEVPELKFQNWAWIKG